MKHKTSKKPIVDNTFDKELINDFKKADTDLQALQARGTIAYYYIGPIRDTLRKIMGDDLAEESSVMTLTNLAKRKKAIRNTQDLLTTTFIQAKKVCSDYLKDKDKPLMKEVKQLLDDLQNVFYEIEYLPENHRTIIKAHLQDKEITVAEQLDISLPSLSNLVQEAIDVLVDKLEKEEKIKSLGIFYDIFLPLLPRKEKTSKKPIIDNTFDKILINDFKKTDSDSKAANAIYRNYMFPIMAMLKNIVDDDDLADRLTSTTFNKLEERKKAIRNTEDLLTITFIEAKKICSDYLKDETLVKQIKQQLDDLQNVFFEIEYLQEGSRTIIKTCLQKDIAAAAEQLDTYPLGIPNLVQRNIDVLIDKLEKEGKTKYLDILYNIFLPLLPRKEKTPQEITVENAPERMLLDGWNIGKPAAIEAVYNYYIVPIAAMLKKTMDTKDVEAIVRVILTRIGGKQNIRNMKDLLTIIFIQAQNTCDCSSDLTNGQTAQQLKELKDVFYEIEYLQEDYRVIIKKCLQNEENEPLPSSNLVQSATDFFISELVKERKVKSIRIFRDIFLPLLLNKN